MPFSELVRELVEMTASSADKLGSTAQVARISDIVAGGTSADRQRKVYNDAIENGAEAEEALRDVVDHLIVETVEGL